MIIVMEFVLTIIIVTLASVSIFRLNSLVYNINISVSANSFVNNHVKYQVALLFLSLLVLLFAYLQDSQNLKLFFSIGDISAPVSPVQWFGIGENRTWIFAGIYLIIVITLGTLAFVYAQFKNSQISINQVSPYAIWILVFSLLNSFSEEAIFRLGIISPLYGDIDTNIIILLSALIFGFVHFGGMPYGIIGMLMAGFLGWFLAKSVVETQGIFWAWLIHFIQDVVIYVGFVAANISADREIRNGPQL